MIVNANIILAKCRTEKELYAMRVEERGGDWVRTWAFRIKEEMARREGFDKVRINGSFDKDAGYPGCPYCGGFGFIVCAVCKKISCFHGEEQGECRWCGYSAAVVSKNKLDVTGGEF